MNRTLFALLILPCLPLGAVMTGCENFEETVKVGSEIAGQSAGMIENEENRQKVLAGVRAVQAWTSEIDTAQEIAIGQSLAVRVFASWGAPYKDEALTRYVAKVGRLVALQSERPSLPYCFAIVDKPEPNALALPGGFVFVSTGLLKQLRSESELAAVLGHEISHVALKDGLEIISRDQRITSLIDLTQQFDKDAAKYRQFIDLTFEKLTTEGYDQRYEWKADEAGTRYAYNAGYDPAGLLPFLEKSAASGGAVAFEVFKTHPDPRVRIDNVRSYLATLGKYTGLPKLQDRYSTEVLARLK